MQASGRLMTALEVMKQVLAESWDGERLAYALPPGLMLVGTYSPVSLHFFETGCLVVKFCFHFSDLR